jgi:predicted ester cyclase
MTDFLSRLLALWTHPLPDDEAAAAAFREVYTDPVRINGADLPVTALVSRARAGQRAFADLRIELIDQVQVGQLDASGQLTIVFRQRGRPVGPLDSPLGQVAATGRHIEVQIIDLLTFEGGRIREVRMVADQLGLLTQLGAIALAGAG